MTLGLAALATVGSGVAFALASIRAGSVTALHVEMRQAPPIANHQIETSGTYPTVSSSLINVAAANHAFLNALRQDQTSFNRLVLRASPDPATAPGVYRTAPSKRYISASSVVVSALVPATEIQPGLNGGSTWFSATVRTPDGHPIAISDLFRSTSAGLQRLAVVLRRTVLARNRCVRESVNQLGGRRVLLAGLTPKSYNFRHFALLPAGLAVGFQQAQIGDVACGRVMVVVSYSKLESSFSEVGKLLMAGVRRPR